MSVFAFKPHLNAATWMSRVNSTQKVAVVNEGFNPRSSAHIAMNEAKTGDRSSWAPFLGSFFG